MTTDSGSVADEGEPGSEETQEVPAPTREGSTPTPPAIEEDTKPDGGSLTDDGSILSFSPHEFKSDDSIIDRLLDDIPNQGVTVKKEEVTPIKEEEKFTTPKVEVNPPPTINPLSEEEKKSSSPPEFKTKTEDFFAMSITQKELNGPIAKPFEEIPSPGKLTVKKEGLFENQESVVMPVIPSSVDNFAPTKEEPPPQPPPPVQPTTPCSTSSSSQTQSGDLFVAPNISSATFPGNSNQINPPPAIKLEPGISEDSLSNERLSTNESEMPRSPVQNTDPATRSMSPIQLTVYPQSSSSPAEPPERKPTPPPLSQSILVPAYPPIDHEKATPLNIPSVPSQHNPFAPFYHPHFHPHSRLDKVNPASPYSMQNEPQNLKIKQEVIAPDQLPPPTDPLQSLKEVKVPGYTGTSISQPLLPTTSSSSISQSSEPLRSESNPPHSPFLGPAIDNIKKEPDFTTHRPITPEKSPLTRVTESTASSPISRSQNSPFPPPPAPPVSSVSNLIAPSPTHPPPPVSLPGPVLHPSQQPSPLSRVSPHLAHPHAFVPAMHHPPHHPLMHHSLLAAAAAHAAAAVHHSPYHPPHPYYSYPFPYGPYPIPQPIPPPTREGKPLESSTMLTSHSVTSRSIREVETRDEALNHHTTQEITQTHHHTTSSTLLHHAEKSNQPQGMTISHSTTSSSSSSVQHKINSSKRTGSPSLQQNPQVIHKIEFIYNVIS